MAEDNVNEIRTIVVDDSPTARQLLVAILESAGDIKVVGVGDDGEEAIELTRQLHPHVVVMGVCMSGVDGLAATRRIMEEMPTPIVIVTSSLRNLETEFGIAPSTANAPKVVRKPSLLEPETCDNVIETVRTMAKVPAAIEEGLAELAASAEVPQQRGVQVIGIAASVGGSAVLVKLLQELTAHSQVPILVVQHIAGGLIPNLVEWLDERISRRVVMAADGEQLRSDVVMIAPHDHHLRVNAQGVIELSQESPYKGLRPSANHLFYSLANVYGEGAIGVVLSGLSDDGALGLEVLHMAGGTTIAQHEDSCVAGDMPRAAVRRDAVDLELAPEEIARKIGELLQ